MNLDGILQNVLLKVNKIAKKNDYNKYIKEHRFEKIFLLLLYHQYSGLEYGRSFTLQMKHLLPDTVSNLSQSELSKKLSYKLSIEVWENIFKELNYQAKDIKTKRSKKFLKMLKIIDSSHLSATKSMDWAKHRSTKNGLKLHMEINGENIPSAFRLKNGNSSDKKSLKWAIQPGYIYVFDRGYNDYSTFSWIGDQDSLFVTRAWSNISYEVIKNRKVGKRQKQKGILSDKIISVIKDRKSDERVEFRIIEFEFRDSNGEYQKFSLLTNLREFRSDDISAIYRERWNIEVMFYWIKTFLKVKNWMSRSKNGVLIQLYSALISYLLVMIAQMKNILNYKIMRDYAHEYSGIILKILQKYFKGSDIENNLLFSG